jgi:hypothetical protein
VPTNLAIDDRLLNAALKAGGHGTKRATVNVLPAIRKRWDLTMACRFRGSAVRGVVASRRYRVVLVAGE